ncbi:hypothetical protein DTO271D3_8369 [Paecilomyces variotii]|nr:hypothetical protein DTO271D3_8369 [Paecilomyces variotii]KAJ9361501.1 hypothetical protein DTO027B9_662 [Paecilomyces variotii]
MTPLILSPFSASPTTLFLKWSTSARKAPTNDKQGIHRFDPEHRMMASIPKAEARKIAQAVGIKIGDMSGDLFIPRSEFQRRPVLEAGQHRRAAILRMNNLGPEETSGLEVLPDESEPNKPVRTLSSRSPEDLSTLFESLSPSNNWLERYSPDGLSKISLRYRNLTRRTQPFTEEAYCPDWR